MKDLCKMIFPVAMLLLSVVCCAGCEQSVDKKKDSDEHHVLCLGNSITRHTPYDAVNWYSDHGMAASKPENDYCHILRSIRLTAA